MILQKGSYIGDLQRFLGMKVGHGLESPGRIRIFDDFFLGKLYSDLFSAGWGFPQMVVKSKGIRPK